MACKGRHLLCPDFGFQRHSSGVPVESRGRRLVTLEERQAIRPTTILATTRKLFKCSTILRRPRMQTCCGCSGITTRAQFPLPDNTCQPFSTTTRLSTSWPRALSKNSKGRKRKLSGQLYYLPGGFTTRRVIIKNTLNKWRWDKNANIPKNTHERVVWTHIATTSL